MSSTSLAPIVFSHANSFPAGTYRVLFDALRRRGMKVRAIEQFGHEPRYPVTNNWPHLAKQLAEFTRTEVERLGQPVFLAGHSMGGLLSLMVASHHPELACGVLMIDAPLLGGWRATGLGMAKRTPLLGAISPGAVSRRRRNSWPDVESAIAHFRHKKAFAKWDAQVLRDYAEHGTREEGGQRVLSFSREVETAIYNTLPDHLDRQLRRHPLKCPAAFIGGLQSQEIRQFGLALTERLTHGRIMMMDGSHLFPMEQPQATAAAIEAALLNLQSVDNRH